MLISRMIHDPTLYPKSSWARHNLAGKTVGLTFHTPKFWNCKKYNWDSTASAQSISGLASDDVMAFRQSQKKLHARCRWPYRHMSYIGYLYWTGPKRRYQFHYMGNPTRGYSNSAKWWGKVNEHNNYVRWRKE